jgi:hypothetical protein
MHYHIFWGLRTAEEPSVLNLSDKDQAIDKFMELIKEVEGDSVKDGPPPFDEKKIDENTYVVRVVSPLYKYMLVYCQNHCDNEEEPYPLNIN